MNTIENDLYSKFNYNNALIRKPGIQENTAPLNTQNKNDEFIKKQPLKNSKLLPFAVILGLTGIIFALLKYKSSKELSLFDPKKFKKAYCGLNNGDRNKIINQKLLFNKNNLDFMKDKPAKNFCYLADIIGAENAGIKIKNFSAPDIVFLSGADQKSEEIQQLLADYLNCKTKTLEYSKGKLKDFLEYLKDFKSKTSNDTAGRTFVGIKNFPQFIADLEKPGRENEKTAFLDFVKNCSKNHRITLFLDNEAMEGLKKYRANAMDIDFRYGIKEDTLQRNLIYTELSRLKKTANLVKSMKAGPVQSDIGFLINNFLENGRTNIVLEEITEKEKALFLDELSKIFDCKQATFNLKDKTINELIQFAKKFKNNFETGKDETILYLQNLEDFLSKNGTGNDEFLKLREFLNTGFDNYGTRIIYDDFKNMPEELLKIPCGQKKLKFSDYTTVFSKKRQEMLGLMEENDFSAFPKNKLEEIRQLINGIAMQQAGQTAPEELFSNIILYGKSKETLDKGASAIMNTLDTYGHTINFDINNPEVSIRQITDIVEKGDEAFKKTGKRTLLLIENLDEFLTDWSTVQKRGLIGRMKIITENSSKKHTNIIMKTTKPWNLFEEASIGGHRFRTKILLEGEKK